MDARRRLCRRLLLYDVRIKKKSGPFAAPFHVAGSCNTHHGHSPAGVGSAKPAGAVRDAAGPNRWRSGPLHVRDFCRCKTPADLTSLRQPVCSGSTSDSDSWCREGAAVLTVESRLRTAQAGYTTAAVLCTGPGAGCCNPPARSHIAIQPRLWRVWRRSSSGMTASAS